MYTVVKENGERLTGFSNLNYAFWFTGKGGSVEGKVVASWDAQVAMQEEKEEA